MWKEILYNMFFKDGQNREEMIQAEETKKKNIKRLEELRKKQGNDAEYYKDELMQRLHIDDKKAMELNGGIDTNVYNV